MYLHSFLFAYIFNKNVETHGDCHVVIFVTQCQDCGDTRCYNTKQKKPLLDLLYLSRVFLSLFLSPLSQASIIQTKCHESDCDFLPESVSFGS